MRHITSLVLPILAGVSLAATGCKSDPPAENQPAPSDKPAAPAAAKPTDKPAPKSPSEAAPAPKDEKSTVAITDGTSDAVKGLLERLTAGAKTPAAALRQVVGGLASRLDAMEPTQPLARTPFTADALATTLTDSTNSIQVTSIEAARLLVAAARALGAEASVVLLETKRAGATSLRHREYAASLKTEGFLGAYAVHQSAERNRTNSTPVSDENFAAIGDALEALSLTEDRRFKDASAKLDSVVKRLPQDAAIQFLGGHLALLQGQSDKGLEAVSAAVKAAPDAYGWYLLAIAYLREGSNFKAYSALHESAKLDPTYAEPWAAIGTLVMERWRNTPEEMRAPLESELDAIEASLMKIGKDAYGLVELRMQRLDAKGERAKAKELGVEALNMFPKRATLHLLMAELAEADGEMAKMERHLERAAEVDPEDAEPLMRLAAIYAQRQEIDKLVTTLQAAAKRAPYDPDILDQLASTLHTLQRIADAQKTAEELRDRFPDLPQGYVRLAEISIASGNALGAAALIEQALTKAPRDGELHILAFFAHTMAKDTEKAAAVVKRYAAFDPDARMKIAEPLLQSGQFEAALALLEEEASLNPKRMEVVLTLAQLHAVMKHPKDVARLRAQVQKESDQPEETLKMFDEAIRQVEAQAAAEENGTAPAPPQ